MKLLLIRRMLTFIATLALASLLVFVLLEWLPGNSAQVRLGETASPEALAALQARLGLDRPAPVRYLSWVSGLLQGRTQRSVAYDTPVSTLIAERLQVSLPLAVLAMLLTVVAALPLGLWAGARHGKPIDTGIMVLSQLGMAVPNFWVAIVLILTFAVQLQWFSAGGFSGWWGDTSANTAVSSWRGLKDLVLPAVALAAVQAAILTRMTRSAVLEVLHEDYVRTAKAKGLSHTAVLWRHVLPNALVPILTVMGLQFASLIAGTIVIENVFVLPGLGRLLFQALANRDLVVVRDVVLLLLAAVMFINLAVDLLVARLDPRLLME